MIVISIGMGARLIGKEEEKGTLELLLAQSISRSRVFFEKALAIFIKVGIVSLAMFASLWFGTIIEPTFDISTYGLFSVSLILFLFSMVFGMIAFMLTGLGLSQKMASGIATGFFCCIIYI
jgi:ABC-2 type transport system permease protein